MTAPGVTVTTALRTGPALGDSPPAASLFLATPALYGPTAVQTCHSLADYWAAYNPTGALDTRLELGTGGTVADLEEHVGILRSFFEEGGTTAYVTRLVGAAPVLASKSLLDATPVPVVTVTARYYGTWANYVTIAVAAGTSSGKKLTFLETTDLGLGIGTSGGIVLDNIATTAAATKAAIEANATLAALFTVTAGAGSTMAVAAAAALTGGTQDPSTAYASAAQTAALARFTPEYGPGAVVVSGLPSVATMDGAALQGHVNRLAAHGEATRRIAIIEAGGASGDGLLDGTTVAGVVDSARTLLVAEHGQTRADELLSYVGAFGPNVLAPSTVVPGSTVALPPTGYVAGVRARTVAAVGVYRSPVGEIATARWVGAPTIDGTTAATIGDADAALIDAAGANAIRSIAGGTRNYGWLALSDSTDWSYLTARDTLNMIAAEADTRTEPLVFRPIDGKGALLAELRGILIGIAEEAKATGAIFPSVDANGDEVDPGYSVDVGPTVNTALTIAAGQINATLSVRISPTAALIDITVTKVAVGAAV